MATQQLSPIRKSVLIAVSLLSMLPIGAITFRPQAASAHETAHLRHSPFFVIVTHRDDDDRYRREEERRERREWREEHRRVWVPAHWEQDLYGGYIWVEGHWDYLR